MNPLSDRKFFVPDSEAGVMPDGRLYHRSSQGSLFSRRACAEKIYFNPDGSIGEVEMTSQGASDPIDAYKTIEASLACRMKGNCYIAPDINGINDEILCNCDGGNW